MKTFARALLAALLAPALTLNPRGALRALALAVLVAAAGCADGGDEPEPEPADDDDVSDLGDDDTDLGDDDTTFEVDAITFNATFTITPLHAGDDDDSAR